MTDPTPAPVSDHGHGARIHDLGYRGYDGPRLGEGGVARSLFVQGLRHAYGLGRSRRAKWLPVGILLVSLLPALVMVSVVAMTTISTLPVDYARYPTMLQMVTSIFVAAQAPVVFSWTCATARSRSTSPARCAAGPTCWPGSPRSSSPSSWSWACPSWSCMSARCWRACRPGSTRARPWRRCPGSWS